MMWIKTEEGPIVNMGLCSMIWITPFTDPVLVKGLFSGREMELKRFESRFLAQKWIEDIIKE